MAAGKRMASFLKLLEALFLELEPPEGCWLLASGNDCVNHVIPYSLKCDLWIIHECFACAMQLTNLCNTVNQPVRCISHPKKAETRMDKGLAADSEKEALYVHIRPPQGGRTKGVAATRLASPASRRRLGGSWRGACCPRPPGLRPLCAHAHGHPLSADQKGGGALGCFGWKFSKSAAGRGN